MYFKNLFFILKNNTILLMPNSLDQKFSYKDDTHVHELTSPYI